MPVLVQNLQAGPTVFSVPEKDISLEWQGKGHSGGEDVQYVDDTLVNDHRFARALRSGILKVVDASPEVMERLAQQDQAFERRQAASAQQTAASMDPARNHDMLSLPCIGPAERGIGTCDTPVPVREKNQYDAPVLCDRHRPLAGDFVQEETGETRVEGDALLPVTRWVRTTIGPRETAAR